MIIKSLTPNKENKRTLFLSDKSWKMFPEIQISKVLNHFSVLYFMICTAEHKNEA